jgi:lipopolysaccharide export system protein LptA
MGRFFAFFLIFCNVFALFAQQQGKKIAFRAEWQFHDQEYLPDVDRLIGNVVFTHENTIGYADSAYFYKEENKMVAFGRPVKIFVNDTVTLYGNRAIYDGESKISTISRHVILKDNVSTLYTDSLIYSTNAGLGYYVTGGKMISKEDTLTSKFGTYNTHNNLANFRRNVILKNPTYVMKCDSFNYNTATEVVYFLCKTHLVSDENDIYTHSGWYDTRNNFAHLFDSVKIISKKQELVSDTAYYDKKLSFGIVKNNVTLVDTARSFIVKGNYGEYLENGGWTWITDSALLILIDKERSDSLYLHADTLKMHFDAEQNPQLLLAYFQVKFFSKEFQGACDSLIYNVVDSVGMMYYNPVVWNGKNQMFGDTIRFSVVDSVTSQIELLQNAFVISDVYDEVEFNQVKGKNIVGFIRNQELKQVNVIHNVELVYYVMDEDTLLIGINRMETNEMKIFLKNNEIEELRFYEYPDGKFWSDKELPMDDRLLKEFRWLDAYRAKEISDIFVNPIPREKTDSKAEKVE